MRFARALLGVWLGACASSPAHDRPTPAADPAPAMVAAHHAAPDPVLRVLIGGDVIPHRPQLLEASSVGAALAPLSALFRSVDATVVNYETATGDVGKIDAPLSLAATPAWMHAIAGANVTALTLANNHACDLGVRGLAASIVTAKSSGVIALGASEDDPWRAHTIASRDGRRVCAVSWTTFVNDRRPKCADSGRLAVAKPGRDGNLRVARAIAAAIHDGCDAVIAIAHGGEEYAPQTEAMMTQARAAADAGADAVVMHHPHVVSPLVVHDTEDARRVPIFASIGNLVTNQGESWTPAYPAAQRDRRIVYLNGWTRIGMIADLDFRLGHAHQKVVAWGHHITWLDSDHVLDKSNPHPRMEARTLDPAEDHAVIDKLARDALGPRAIFEDTCWIERRGADATSGPTCRP